MNNILKLPLALFLLINSTNLFAQKDTYLQYFKHIAQFRDASSPAPSIGAIMNENGWFFTYLGDRDSLFIDGFKAVKDNGIVILAFDKSGKLRWTFSYTKEFTSLGGMRSFACGPDNSVYAFCGVKDSIKIHGLSSYNNGPHLIRLN